MFSGGGSRVTNTGPTIHGSVGRIQPWILLPSTLITVLVNVLEQEPGKGGTSQTNGMGVANVSCHILLCKTTWDEMNHHS
jgi:hypothetical protein